MRTTPLVLTVVAAILTGSSFPAFAQSGVASLSADKAAVSQDYGKLPLSFEANQGQTDAQVRFLSHGRGYSLFLTDSAAVLRLSGDQLADRPATTPKNAKGPAKPAAGRSRTDVVSMELAGASPNAKVQGMDRLPGTANYFIGNNPAKWHKAVPTYAKVRYTGVYPGVNLVYYGNQQQLEYDFVVSPGADPKPIKLHLDGAKRLRLDDHGNLVIYTGDSHVVFNKPVVYQQSAGERQPVPGRFRLLAGNTVGFVLGGYDHTRPLVIDPTLAYSTYLAAPGSNSDIGGIGYAVTADSAGNVYVVGLTGLPDFPVTTGAIQTTLNQSQYNSSTEYPFVAKLDPTGSELLYSTYLSGSGNRDEYGDSISGIYVNSAGDAYVTGRAFSPDFPMTDNAYQTTNNSVSYSESNCFLSELNPTGTSLVYSTYLGGEGYGDWCVQVMVNSAGDAYVAGTETSTNFPTTPGSLPVVNSNGRDKAFVTEFNPGATALVYSTLMGGSSNDFANGMALDSSGNVYVTGQTYSTDFPVTANAFQTINEAYVARSQPTGFVAKLNSTGSALDYATYLGGTGGSDSSIGDDPTSIAVDSAGEAYVAGVTTSQDFPLQSPIQTTNKTYAGNGYVRTYTTGFVTKVNTTGSGLIFSTYLGSSAGEIMTIPGVYSSYNSGPASQNLALDSSGDVYITGGTYGIDFPVTSGAFQSYNHAEEVSGSNVYAGSTNAFLTELTSSGTLQYSTYLGGMGEIYYDDPSDYGSSLALDPSGNVYITGLAFSNDFPTTPGAFQTNKSADYAAFISKFSFGSNTKGSLTTLRSSANPESTGTTVTFTAQVESVSGTGVPTGTVTFSFDGGVGSPVTLNSSGVATYPTNALSDGTHTVAASYSGDSNYSASSNTLTQLIAGVPASVAVVSGSGQSGCESVPLANPIVVIVEDANGTPVPNVSVSFGGTGLSYLDLGNSSSYYFTTDYSGKAYAIVIPTATGSLTGKATVSGVNTPAFFTFTGSTTCSIPAPVFSPGTETFTGASISVAINDAMPGTQIYYTTNGATPTVDSTFYTHPITVTGTETIQAIAAETGLSNSASASATYTKVLTTPSPTFSPAPGTYSDGVSVTLTDPGATIYYTTDGSTPTTSSTQYETPLAVSHTETIKAIGVASGEVASPAVSGAYTIAGLQFIPVSPCRIADTRNPNGPYGGPEMAAGTTREFDIPPSGCGIPSTALAYSLNVTVVPNAGLGYLSLWPSGESQPLVSTLNSDGRIKANAAIVPAGTNGGVDVYVSDATQVILDINGYFVAAGTPSALEFYPLTPCRVADTRNANAPLGGPSLTGGAAGRAFPILSSGCGVPSSAEAYSLNITAVPHSSLGYLATWPTGETQPLVSTLNAPTGAVTANAAVVPAGTGGEVSVYVSDTSDVILDINGYFAAPGAGGLSLYTLTPCRVIDTRVGAGAFNGILTVGVGTSSCAPSQTPYAYVLNDTVVPQGGLGYLTLWPTGETQPYVSTLNAQDGAVTSNMSIVPTINGSVSAYSSSATNLILDLSGYFAP